MRKLRLYFGLLFLLLAVPIGILISYTYANLEEESFFFYRRGAEGVVASLQQQLSLTLADEENRPYTHYRYIYVADQPVPEQEGLNLSPLSGFPVEANIPGILGYYQIDPDGSFHSPLLPDDRSSQELTVPELEKRVEVKNRLAGLLEDRSFYVSSGPERQGERRYLQGSSMEDSTTDLLKESLESNLDVRLEEEYYRGNAEVSAPPSMSARLMKESAQPSERRLQKATPKQALVFDSQDQEEGLYSMSQLRDQVASGVFSNAGVGQEKKA